MKFCFTTPRWIVEEYEQGGWKEDVQTDRERDGQTNRQTDMERQGWTNRETESFTHTERERERERGGVRRG